MTGSAFVTTRLSSVTMKSATLVTIDVQIWRERVMGLVLLRRVCRCVSGHSCQWQKKRGSAGSRRGPRRGLRLPAQLARPRRVDRRRIHAGEHGHQHPLRDEAAQLVALRVAEALDQLDEVAVAL